MEKQKRTKRAAVENFNDEEVLAKKLFGPSTGVNDLISDEDSGDSDSFDDIETTSNNVG